VAWRRLRRQGTSALSSCILDSESLPTKTTPDSCSAVKSNSTLGRRTLASMVANGQYSSLSMSLGSARIAKADSLAKLPVVQG
jgi:hypothetical protein